MNVNIQFQVAGLVIITILMILYATSKHMHTKSNTVFKLLLKVSMALIVLDIITYLMIAYQEQVNPYALKIGNQLYLTLVATAPYLVFIYIVSSIRKDKKPSYLIALLTAIPAICSIIAVDCQPILYVRDDVAHLYSTGVGTSFIYASSAIYFIALGILSIIYRNKIHLSLRISILEIFTIELFTAAIQFFEPFVLLVAFSSAIINFLLFCSLENPSDILDKVSGAFSKNGFTNVVSTNILNEKEFHVFVVLISDYNRIRSSFGIELTNAMIKRFVESFSVLKCASVALIENNQIAIVYNCKKEEALREVERIQFLLGNSVCMGAADYLICPYYCFISFPYDVKTLNDIFDGIAYSLEEAKTQSGNSLVFFKPEFVEKQKRVNLIDGIVKEAVEKGKIDVYFQPIYSVKDGTFTSAEALVRLQDTGYGYFSPEEFIPIAEKNGYIIQLGEIVFEKVCALIQLFDLEKFGIEYIEINLSGVQCMQANLAEELEIIMKRYAIEPQFINLEITETAALHYTDRVIDTMTKMIKNGVQFSLDDYGTGYSSMQYIMKFPFSIIKFDKSMIWSYFEPENDKARIILATNVLMIKQLGMKIVAEGVETSEQAEKLASIGIDYFQGFYYSRAINSQNYIAFIKQHNIKLIPT